MSGNDLRSRDDFDIVTNGVGVWPSTAVEPRAVRLAQGISDTSAEALLIGCAGTATDCVRGPSTSGAFAASKMAGWIVATSDAAPGWAQIPAEPRVLASADLAAGYVVVMPPKVTTDNATWWRARPDTGETLGMGLMGGNVYAETAGILTSVMIGGYYCNATSSSETGRVGCLVGLDLGGIGGLMALETVKIKALGFAIAMLGLIVAGESNRTD